MRRLRAITLQLAAMALTTLPPSPSTAQDPSVVEVTLAAVSMERKSIVADRMQLTVEEAREFWPIYNDYLRKHEDLTKRLGELVRTLALEFETLDEETANDLLERYHDFREDRLGLRWHTAKKLRRKIGSKRAGRFYQLENKLDTLADMTLVKSVPLVE